MTYVTTPTLHMSDTEQLQGDSPPNTSGGRNSGEINSLGASGSEASWAEPKSINLRASESFCVRERSRFSGCMEEKRREADAQTGTGRVDYHCLLGCITELQSRMVMLFGLGEAGFRQVVVLHCDLFRQVQLHYITKVTGKCTYLDVQVHKVLLRQVVQCTQQLGQVPHTHCLREVVL